MINYYSIIKDSSTYYFYNNDNSILFLIDRQYIYPKYIFTVKNHQEKEVLIFEVRNKLFSTQRKILFQDFKEKIILEGKNKLIVGEKIISINENYMILKKYKSSISVNNHIIGEINSKHIFPHKKYLISFNEDDPVNYYCIVLFLIMSIYFADGV